MQPKIHRSAQKTRAKIVQRALEMFNEKGTAAVSMNALAASLGISAGHLQYHYRNKKEIIRAILEVMTMQFDLIYEPVQGAFTLEALRQVMRTNFAVVWKYRFFFRGFAALIRNDEILARRLREIQKKRFADQEALMQRLVEAGVLRSGLGREELQNIITIGLVLTTSWLSYAESMGQKMDGAAMEQAVELMVQHYKPYLVLG